MGQSISGCLHHVEGDCHEVRESDSIQYLNEKRFIAVGTLVILTTIYAFAMELASSPGTYAWFTSQTEASGTIENAVTADLLDIEPSNLLYGENCSLSHSLSVTNISSIDTVVTIEVIGREKEDYLDSAKLHPGESLSTNPTTINDFLSDCTIDHFEYHILAFGTYVDEIYTIPVDQTKLLETIKVVPPLEEETAEDSKTQDETDQMSETECPQKEEPDQNQKSTENQDESKVQIEETCTENQDATGNQKEQDPAENSDQKGDQPEKPAGNPEGSGNRTEQGSVENQNGTGNQEEQGPAEDPNESGDQPEQRQAEDSNESGNQMENGKPESLDNEKNDGQSVQNQNMEKAEGVSSEEQSFGENH